METTMNGVKNIVKKMDYSDPILRRRISELQNEGYSYNEVAERLNKEGYEPPQSKKFTASHIWFAISGSKNLKKRRKMNASSRSTEVPVTRKVALVEHKVMGTSKWDVLQAIESCINFNKSTKRALMELILDDATR